jgi:hypothetical protein
MSTLTHDGGATDGVQGLTKDADHNGMFGWNKSDKKKTGVDPGGNGVFGFSEVPGGAGVFGAHNSGDGVGVSGTARGSEHGALGFEEGGRPPDVVGVLGAADVGDGVRGITGSAANSGVFGRNDSPAAAEEPGGSGVFGLTSTQDGAGVFGANSSPWGRLGKPGNGRGVQGNGPAVGVGGYSKFGIGVTGQSDANDGVQGFTDGSGSNAILGRNSGSGSAPTDGPPAGNGVFGYTDVIGSSGVCGAVAASNTTAAGVTGIGPTAGRFLGNLTTSGDLAVAGNAAVTGDVTVSGDLFLPGADCAEDFDVAEPTQLAEGDVVVLDEAGAIRQSQSPYDRRVAGVVSGAGCYRPGIRLDATATHEDRRPVALVGKTYCKVDADVAPIRVGDLLTSSGTPGHAMRADDPHRAFGSVIGKALSSCDSGKGLLPILVCLQ